MKGVTACISYLLLIALSTKADPNDPDAGNGWDIRLSVPGEPDLDYPVLNSIPYTSFNCFGRPFGYYADPETRCQVFKVCANTATEIGGFFSFLCPNGTLFNQQVMVCDWWMNVRCDDLESQYPDTPIENLAIKSPAAMMANIKAMITYPMRNPYPLIPAIKTTMQIYNPPSAMFQQQVRANLFPTGNGLAKNAAFAFKNANAYAEAEKFANSLNSAQEQFARIQASNHAQIQNQLPFLPRSPVVVTVPINFPSANPIGENTHANLQESSAYNRKVVPLILFVLQPPNHEPSIVESFNRSSINNNNRVRADLREAYRNETRAANHNYDAVDNEKGRRHFTANVASQTNIFLSNRNPYKKEKEDVTSTTPNPDSEIFSPGGLSSNETARLVESKSEKLIETNELSSRNESFQFQSSTNIAQINDSNLVTLLSAHIIPGGDLTRQKILKLCVPKDVLSYLLKLHNSTKSIIVNSLTNTGELMNEPIIKRIMHNFLIKHNLTDAQVPELVQQRYESEQKFSTVEATKTSIVNQTAQSVQKIETEIKNSGNFQIQTNTTKYSEHVAKGVSSFNNNKSAQQNHIDGSLENRQIFNGYYAQNTFDGNNNFQKNDKANVVGYHTISQTAENTGSLQTNGQVLSQQQNLGYNQNTQTFAQQQNLNNGGYDQNAQMYPQQQFQNNLGYSQNTQMFSQRQQHQNGAAYNQNTQMFSQQQNQNNAGFNQNRQTFTQQRVQEGGVKGQQVSNRELIRNNQGSVAYNGFVNTQYTQNQNIPGRQFTQYQTTYSSSQSTVPQVQQQYNYQAQINQHNRLVSQNNNMRAQQQQGSAEFEGYSAKNQYGAITTTTIQNQFSQQQPLNNTSRYEIFDADHPQPPVRIKNDQIFHNPYVNGRIQNAQQIEKNSEIFADNIQVVHPATLNETAELGRYMQAPPTYSSFEYNQMIKPTFATFQRQTGIVYAEDRTSAIPPTQAAIKNYNSNNKAFAQIKQIFPNSNPPAGFMVNNVQQQQIRQQQQQQQQQYYPDTQYGYQYDGYQNGQQTDDRGYTMIEVVPALGFALDSRKEKQDYESGIQNGHRNANQVYIPPYQETETYNSNTNGYQTSGYEAPKNAQYNRVTFVEQQQRQVQQPLPTEDFGYPQEKPSVPFTF